MLRIRSIITFGNLETYLAEIRGSTGRTYLLVIDTILKALSISLYLSPQTQQGAIFLRSGAQVFKTTEDSSRRLGISELHSTSARLMNVV